jgi:hypothetical protein
LEEHHKESFEGVLSRALAVSVLPFGAEHTAKGATAEAPGSRDRMLMQKSHAQKLSGSDQ